MVSKTEVRVGKDWCTLQLSGCCLTESRGMPVQCIQFGESVLGCHSCLKKLFEEEFPEDFEWTLKDTYHDGDCQTITVNIGSEEVTFCPTCLVKVLAEYSNNWQKYIGQRKVEKE